jgi:CHAD domain-containing protein
MSRKLSSPHFHQILKEWRDFLESPAPKQPVAAPNATRPMLELANERIWKMYNRVLKEGRAIADDSPPEDLHELRKSCKKLRYLMEFFQSLYPQKQVKTLVKVIKGLLDNLGNFQDLEVQSHTLQGFAGRMMEEGVGGRDTLLAMGALIGGLSQRQQEAREEFAVIFTHFDTPEHRLLFKSLFGAGKGKTS